MINKNIVGYSGKVLHSDLSKKCLLCVNECNSKSEIVDPCPIFSEKRRRGKVEDGLSQIYICSSDENLVNSSRLFKEKINVYVEMLNELIVLKDEIKEDINQETKRLIHNLTSLNAHSIQDLYNLVPQELLTKNFKDQLNITREIISENLDEAASTFLRIAKNNASIKTEFSVFNKLYETNPALNLKKHNIRKVVFNLLYIFFQDFTDSNIYVSVDENYDSIIFDYESLHVSLYHLFENATKYAKPNQDISITFSKGVNYFDVDIRMISIQITNDDFLNLFDEKYSGIYAKQLNRAGSGIGLNRVKRILELNNARLIINRNVSPNVNVIYDKIPYEKNEFKIRFDLSIRPILKLQ
ncbi:MAG: ATP-binding protein [Ferruginibacter sp.]